MVWNCRRDSRKRVCFIHVTVTNSLGFTLQDCIRVMEHTHFLLLTRSTSVEGCCSRIKREARKITECTSYTPCVLLSFSSRGNIFERHKHTYMHMHIHVHAHQPPPRCNPPQCPTAKPPRQPPRPPRSLKPPRMPRVLKLMVCFRSLMSFL